jgi:hypothetical protein
MIFKNDNHQRIKFLATRFFQEINSSDFNDLLLVNYKYLY